MTSIASDDPYASEYPTGSKIDSEVQAFFRHYYNQVDTQGNHVQYSECWAEDGILIVPNGKVFRGREAIKNVHLGMWDGVPKRLHRPVRVYPYGDNPDEVMIFGSVEYWPSEAAYAKKDMAVRAKYQRNVKSGVVEMSSLQVWLTGLGNGKVRL